MLNTFYNIENMINNLKISYMCEKGKKICNVKKRAINDCEIPFMQCRST